jgi:hypothetical protein
MREPSSFVVALLAVGFAAGCDGPPDRPSHVDIFRTLGPAELTPGTTTPFKAVLDTVATLSDVSKEAQWISSNPAVLSVDAGVATAHAAGEATITAMFEGLQTAPSPVLVVPAGTYRLAGVSRFADTQMPLSMVRVEVPAVGLMTTTDAQGRYILYGVPQDAEIRATKEGYVTAVTSVHPVNQTGYLPIAMRPAIEGTYTLSIGPGTCSDGPAIPASLLQRTYKVTLVQRGSMAAGTFPGADNITPVQFSATFDLGVWDVSFVIGEQLPDGKVLTINGAAFVRPTDLAGAFNGRLAITEPSTGDILNRCTASAFRFALSR